MQPDEIRCTSCASRIVIVPAGELAGLVRSPVLRFGTTFHDVTPDATTPLGLAAQSRDLSAAFVVLAGEGAGVRITVARRTGGGGLRARLPHAPACGPARETVRAPGDPAACSGCARGIVWIVTPAGKKAPLDPEAFTGREITLGEARRRHGDAGVVVGLDANGRQAAVLVAGGFAFDGGEQTTVWKNHFATCPERARFVRPRARA